MAACFLVVHRLKFSFEPPTVIQQLENNLEINRLEIQIQKPVPNFLVSPEICLKNFLVVAPVDFDHGKLWNVSNVVYYIEANRGWQNASVLVSV